MTRALLRKLTRKPVRLDHWLVTVYTRLECCCCHKAIDLLETYQSKHKFSLEQIDIDQNPDLAALYNTEVPVVSINGKVRFKGDVNPVLLDRLIAAEAISR